MTSLRDAHPDEGTIHAWLDRQLDATSSATLEAHLQRCDECAERVAEARGLIAGTSRILAALDGERAGSVPALRATPGALPPVAPATPAPPATPPFSPAGRGRWRGFRVTPARAAIAATIVVAAGLLITRERAGIDTVSTADSARTSATMSAPAGALAPRPRDALLDSAVARNLAQAQPRRAVEASPGAHVAIPDAASPAAARAMSLDSASATRVAVARGAVRAQRETTVGSDLARVAQPAAPTVPVPLQQTIAAAKVADRAAENAAAGAVAGKRAGFSELRGSVPAIEVRQCLRVESATGTAATWGSVSLPFVIALDAPGTSPLARVLTPAGEGTESYATWKRAGNDSLQFTLRRIGYAGTLVLGEPGEVRAGVMRSSASSAALGSVVATGVETAERAGARKLAREGPLSAQEAASSAPATPVVARRIDCP